MLISEENFARRNANITPEGAVNYRIGLNGNTNRLGNFGDNLQQQQSYIDNRAPDVINNNLT
jgi:hypothetical protein